MVQQQHSIRYPQQQICQIIPQTPELTQEEQESQDHLKLEKDQNLSPQKSEDTDDQTSFYESEGISEASGSSYGFNDTLNMFQQIKMTAEDTVIVVSFRLPLSVARTPDG